MEVHIAMRKIILFLIIILINLDFLLSLWADSGAEYTIIRTTVPPRIDGKLDDIIWKLAQPAELALINAKGTKATKKSLAYAVYDDNFIYVAFHRIDKDLGKIVANTKNHDGNVWEDDEFELFLDVDHDHVTYWQVCVNTLNTIWDCYNPGGGCNGGDNIECETNVSVGPKEDWFAEIKIAFKALGVKNTPKPNDVWGVNFCGRVRTGIDEWVTWSDIGPSFHVPTGFGNMIFSSKALAVKPVNKLPISWGIIKNL